jgi:hypothetical protein
MWGNNSNSNSGVNVGVVGAADIYGGAGNTGGGATTKSAAGWTYIWFGVAVFILFFSTFTTVRHMEG